jgi:hypothetical protein
LIEASAACAGDAIEIRTKATIFLLNSEMATKFSFNAGPGGYPTLGCTIWCLD